MKLLRYIRPIVTLAEHRHFGRAARALGVTQPALSLMIRNAERDLNARLFDRTRGEVTLTPFGQAAVRRCREMLASAAEMVREVDALKGLGGGRLVVSCGTYPAEISGQRAIGHLMAAHPGLSCSIQVREWHQTIRPVLVREADLALAEIHAAESDPRLISEVIGVHPCVFFCRPGHPLTRVKSPALGQIAAFPWALPSLPPRIFAMIDQPRCAAGRLDDTGEQFIPAVHVQTLSASKQIVQLSDAISGAPRFLIEEDVRAGRLAIIDFAAPWARLNYGFIYLRDRTLSAAARAFMAEVRKIEAQAAQFSSADAGRIASDKQNRLPLQPHRFESSARLPRQQKKSCWRVVSQTAPVVPPARENARPTVSARGRPSAASDASCETDR